MCLPGSSLESRLKTTDYSRRDDLPPQKNVTAVHVAMTRPVRTVRARRVALRPACVQTQSMAMARIQREKRTVSVMIEMYCHAQHSTPDALCAECKKRRDYALARLDRCPFGDHKPTCARCPVHCYKPDMKAQIKEVMRYAGPRMLGRHPLLALMHQLDSLRRSSVSKTD